MISETIVTGHMTEEYSEAPGAFLAVDRGNTRLKATWMPAEWRWSDAEGVETRTYDPADSESLMEWVEELSGRSPLAGALAAVGKVDARLVESLRKALAGKFLMISSSTSLPIGMRYSTPGTLGIDRKATACAAAARYPGEMLAVVDSGTALTVDIVTAAGEFLGGNISPGLQMRLDALHEHTARLPRLVARTEGLAGDWGSDTCSAIWNGACGGWADETAMALARAAGSARRAIVTGGDLPRLREMLPARLEAIGCRNLTIDYDPHLLAEGMREIYRHHENEI